MTPNRRPGSSTSKFHPGQLEPIGICNSGNSGMVGMNRTLIFHLIFHLIPLWFQGSRKRLSERLSERLGLQVPAQPVNLTTSVYPAAACRSINTVGFPPLGDRLLPVRFRPIRCPSVVKSADFLARQARRVGTRVRLYCGGSRRAAEPRRRPRTILCNWKGPLRCFHSIAP